MKKEWASAINEDAKRLGNLVRNVRESSGMTMRQLAQRIGISHTAISQLEHGKLELPRARIEQIVSACGHSMVDFEKVMDKGFMTPNYRTECASLIKVLDDEALSLVYHLLVRLSAQGAKAKPQLEAL